MLVEAFIPARVRRPVQVTLGLAAPAAALIAVAALWSGVASGKQHSRARRLARRRRPDPRLQGTIALLALLSILVVADRTDTGEDAFAPSTPPRRAEAGLRGSRVAAACNRWAEVYPLLLFAVKGMLIFPAAGDLLTLFVALEVLSLPLYLLTGMARRRRLLSQEAAMKYFLLGAFASAIMLFGIALLYGYSGSLRYSDIAEQTLQVTGSTACCSSARSSCSRACCSRSAPSVPAPGRPTSTRAHRRPSPASWPRAPRSPRSAPSLRLRRAAGPRVGPVGGALDRRDRDYMVVSTVAALVQTDIKRILAYSSIAHAGFILTGIVALDESAIPAAAVLPAGLWRGDDRRVRHRLAGARARGRHRRRAGSGARAKRATRLSQWAGLGRTDPVLAVTFARCSCCRSLGIR